MPTISLVFSRRRTPASERRMLFMRICFLVVMELLLGPIITLLYLSVIREGLVDLFPILGQKLSKLQYPFLHLLARWSWSYRLDLASLFSLVILFCVVGS